MKPRWYVQGDPKSVRLPTKIEAERRARNLFPDEDVDKRYARVMQEQPDDGYMSEADYQTWGRL